MKEKERNIIRLKVLTKDFSEFLIKALFLAVKHSSITNKMGEIFTALDGLKLKASESVPVKHDESNDTHTDAATSICFYRLNGRTDERETLSRETRTYAGSRIISHMNHQITSE
ncbi:LOW QUALITY PROTEIN: hypothetical protein V1477_013157 [Vespula maculifrons]|uniref:Uncharacterized protein n=1 Tax=Vespula maculifrons TaxID=7453 RepID=A0ABD2BV44_VESMC